jgi:DNA-binding CsgD family transcriptional regulator
VRSSDNVVAMLTPEGAAGRAPEPSSLDASRPLRGRRRECEIIDRLLEGMRSGRSGALVVRGEAGVGKTALLEYATQRASGCRVARIAGVQSEMELAFAGLHQLCAPMLDRLERLPDPQRDALRTTFGLSLGPVPDRFLVDLAVLSLLCDVADERPLVCVIDDAHWLDRTSAQSLAFVARRLLADSVAIVFAVREPSDLPELAGLPDLEVRGLRVADARALLGSVITAPLDERVRDRIVAETRGNPLALLELPRGLTPAQLAGGFGLPDAPALSGRIEESFRRRLEALPPDTQRLLLIAAADPVGDPTLLWRAVAQLGIGVDAAAPAEAAGLVEFGAMVRFRHPLTRSAVYQPAAPAERQAAHRALAAATDPEVDPDRRAWHRAQAAPAPDDEVADELERSAGRAQARGGLAASAAFLERAAGLTLEQPRRAQRALAAAQAKHGAGAPDAALALLASAEAGPLDELESARVDLLRAQVAFAVNRGRDAPPLLLKAAKRLESLDVSLARETYLDALSASTFVGRLSGGVGLLEVARAARAAPKSPQPPRAADLLLDGLALLITQGYAAGGPTLKRALGAFCSERISTDEEIRWLWLAGHAALDLWDDETWHVLAARHLEVIRDAGALAVLPIALNTRIGVHLSAGEFGAAASLLEEVRAVTEATASHLAPYVGLALAAFRGDEAQANELFAATMSEVLPRGEGIGLTIAHWARALLCNSLGRYDDALAAAELASEHPEDLRFCTRALVELIEAAARSGQPERAADALRRLTESTRASGTELALGTEARSRALLSEGEAAESLYREAIERLAHTRVSTAVARAHLLYGEWLRRQRRRLDARTQLRIAHEMFTSMGMEAFTDRAARELLATGERARRRTLETSGHLTAQEAQIARLAGDGQTNPEIAARLFLSPRTVEWHLRKVFAKLDISSRNQLARIVPDAAPRGISHGDGVMPSPAIETQTANRVIAGD